LFTFSFFLEFSSLFLLFVIVFSLNSATKLNLH
jgi:hypothetical protein